MTLMTDRLTWEILRFWLGAMIKGLFKGEFLTGWFLLSKGQVQTWLPFRRCLDKYCPPDSVYLLHVWAYTLKGREPSTWIDYREDIPMRIERTLDQLVFGITVTMPTPRIHLERPWAVKRWVEMKWMTG